MLHSYKTYTLILESKAREKKINKVKNKIKKFLNIDEIVDFIIDLCVNKQNTEGLQYAVWIANYVKDDQDINLYDYIIAKGFKVINLTTLEQMSYASNFLTIANKKILAIEVERVVDSVLTNLQVKAKENPKRYGKLFEQAKQDYKMRRTINLINEGS